MPFDCARAGFRRPRPSLRGERVHRPGGEAGARGFSLGSLSIAIVAAIVLGGALTLFSLAASRAGGEALRAVALAAALREAVEQSLRPEEEGPVAEAVCAALARDERRCRPEALRWSRRGRVLLRLEAAAIEDGLLRLRWRAEQGRRGVRAETVIAGKGPG